MFRVLIVEDEVLVREGLKNYIDWNKFNMTVIADATDGQTALEMYQKYMPDLIITDLKMPVMDGMELISKIREKDKKTRIIILSCLEEFSIVRKAISLGVSDYILKVTMTEEEIEAVLNKAQNELSNLRNKNPDEHNNLKIDVVKEKFLKEYLFYNAYTSDEFEIFVTEAGLRMNPARLITCIMEVDHFETLLARFNDEKGQLVKSAILDMLNGILDDCGRGEAFCDNEKNYVIIFSFHDIPSEQSLYSGLLALLNNIKNMIDSRFNVPVSFGISSLNNGYGSLGKMYRESRKALEQKFFSGAKIFFYNSAPDFDRIIVEKIDAIRRLPELLKILGDHEMKDYNEKIDCFLNTCSKDKEQIQKFFLRLLQWSSSLLYTRDDNLTDYIVVYTQKIQKSETLDEVIDAFKGFVAEITNAAMKKRILGKEVSEALQYIQCNYTRNISLMQVAKHVKLSPNYLGNLFRKELGMNYIEYLNKLRIAKAKNLLLGTHLKSYEIAEKVGFAESTYFCKVFKKMAGMSPDEFRKQMMKKWSGEMENEDAGKIQNKKYIF